jgi:hypothetical protein
MFFYVYGGFAIDVFCDQDLGFFMFVEEIIDGHILLDLVVFLFDEHEY